MKHRIIHTIAITLVGIILGVSAWLPFQILGHTKAHAQHHAATHATPLCTLFCNAGQIAQIADPTPDFALSYAFNLIRSNCISYLRVHTSPLLARGPPITFPFALNF